jgi:hypothetical protein
MAQKGFPENPKVGDTFKKDGKNYIYQGDRWVVKGDFAGPNPGTKSGQEWTNTRTKKTYVWDANTKTWGEKGATSPSTTTTSTTATTPSTTVAPTATSPSTTVPVTTTTMPVTTTTMPVTNTTASGIPGGSVGATRDYQSDYIEAQNSAYGYLTKISKAQRIEFLNTLYSKGFGGTRKPTTGGLEPSDIEMAAQFYVYFKGNQQSTTNPSGFLTTDQAYKEIQTWKTQSTAGAGKFTPKTDVASVFRQVMQNDLGRAPTDQEIERFSKAYRGLESGGNAPNLSSAAEEQIEETMPGESEAAAFSSYANVFEQLMRGA